jgi:pyruvyltransferase
LILPFPVQLPLYYWQSDRLARPNFGDYCSWKLVQKIAGDRINPAPKGFTAARLFAIGSILHYARDHDVVWGSGINGKHASRRSFRFSSLDIRAVRGPLTGRYFVEQLNIACPEIYGDPALLLPRFFPEFRRAPVADYVVVLHYLDKDRFPKDRPPEVVYADDPWETVMERITGSRLVISSALHGLVVAEAYGIPARMLRLSEKEPLFKYDDYYRGTGREETRYANSIEEALAMGGEKPYQCDIEALFRAFPFEFWPDLT